MNTDTNCFVRPHHPSRPVFHEKRGPAGRDSFLNTSLHRSTVRGSFVAFAICFMLGLAGRRCLAADPEPVPGWRMELVAEAPRVNHPSVVCTAPDGRVFVAEDPMDISVAADAKKGRILCLHPDGHWSVFAEGLHAVFGMQYLEGRLYVLDNPQFSVFDDRDGVGANRRDLIEQTNPKPWALDWNDHVPSNFKLAMDGYFYIAVGDKGLFGARGTDGREINLHGGGVVRMRPDGTGLEIFSAGVRNILDVAINDEDEIFTYDNTDEHDWMGRVTHMVAGGFYGYPHDFIPRRPYTLWMMDDLGGGAACGTLCYTEDALPAEYHGNLFLADFGQRQVNRLVIERAGATYRVVKREQMFPDPPPDFRPVGIAWSADGLSMFICDWQHRDDKEDVRAGRLWKLTWTGKSNAAPKPNWYVAAASGKTVDTNETELLTALGHPARSVRLTAQRRLTEMGRGSNSEKTINDLINLLRDLTQPGLARIHALWALDAIDEGRSARSAIGTLAAREPHPEIRAQAIRQLSEREVAEAAPVLVERLHDDVAFVRLQAATALGRLGQTSAVTNLLEILNEQDLFARYAAFKTLNRIGQRHPEAWEQIAKGLLSDDDRVREGARFAMRDTYDVQLVKVLARFVQPANRPSAASRVALELLADIHHQPTPWRGEWWAYHPALQPLPKKSADWEGTPLILSTLHQALGFADPEMRRIAINGILDANDATAAPIIRDNFKSERDPEIQRLSVAALGKFKDPQSRSLIAELLSAPDTTKDLQIEALSAAGEIAGEPVSAAVSGVLTKAKADPTVLGKAITTLTSLKLTNAVDLLTPYAHGTDATLRQAALEALVKIDPANALATIEFLLAAHDSGQRASAVTALSRIRSDGATDLLLVAFNDPATRTAAINALAGRPMLKALPTYLAGIQESDAALRETSRRALESIRQEAWRRLVPHLKDINATGLSILKKIYGNDDQARAYFAKVPDLLEPQEYVEYAVRQNGDVTAGKRLFNDLSGPGCIACHRIGGEGNSIGPDLTSIGAQYSRNDLSESVLYPSKVVREGYQAVDIETKDGESFTGLAKGETATEVMLLLRTGQLQHIPKDSIRSRRNSELSLMPEGLQSALTLDQFASLISYLSSLKGSPVLP